MSHFGISGKICDEACCGEAQILPQSEERFEFRSVIFILCLWITILIIVTPRFPRKFFIYWTALYCWCVYRCDLGTSVLPTSRRGSNTKFLKPRWAQGCGRHQANIVILQELYMKLRNLKSNHRCPGKAGRDWTGRAVFGSEFVLHFSFYIIFLL